MSRGGHRYGRRHSTVESCHSLTAWGYFEYAQHGDEPKDFDVSWEPLEADRFKIDHVRYGEKFCTYSFFERTSCHYGGSRMWFICPRCFVRVAKLFLPVAITVNGLPVNKWQCRNCYQLSYEGRQQRNHYWDYTWRAERIGHRWLKISENWIGRPKGQHTRTFKKRADQYEAIQNAAEYSFFLSMQPMLNKYGIVT